jgi:hypothetical protein
MDMRGPTFGSGVEHGDLVLLGPNDPELAHPEL